MKNSKVSLDISESLLNILACPKCKGALRLSAKPECFICEKCKLLYPVKEGIPLILIDEVEVLNG